MRPIVTVRGGVKKHSEGRERDRGNGSRETGKNNLKKGRERVTEEQRERGKTK